MKNFEDVKKIAKNCLKCKNAPCQAACPVNNPIPRILEEISLDNIENAKQLLFENTNACLVCSKLCDFEKNCFGHCVLSKIDKGIKFFEVEAFLSKDFKKTPDTTCRKTVKVAIIGSGISGISVAIDLSSIGYDVTIYEKNNFIGGVITDSLPNFRYDDSVIKIYENILKRNYVKIELNKEFGENLFLEDLKEFKFVVFAMGTRDVRKSLENVDDVLYQAMDLLKLAKNNMLKINNKKILVIGGGNIAIDVARTLKRLNNDVSIIYRRNKANAPSSKKEINLTIEENIKWIECVAPKGIIKDNGKYLLEVEKMNLEKVDESSRLKFVSTGVFDYMECDLVVEAIGLMGNYDYLRVVLPNLFDGRWPKTDGYLEENNQIYLVTGDYLTGASSFAEATKQAKITAERIKELCK